MQCAKTTSSTPAPKSNRNMLSILNIKSVLGSYTDLGGLERAKFLCGHDNLQLKSPQALPLEWTWGSWGRGALQLPEQINFKDHMSGRKSSSGKRVLDPSGQGRLVLSEASSLLNSHNCACRRQERGDGGSKFPECFQMHLAHS